MKGLRLFPSVIINWCATAVRIDLIYEGIATPYTHSIMWLCPVRPNWPDLWRDCDPFILVCYFKHVTRPNWPDLWRDCDLCSLVKPSVKEMSSELTWFMKGLRPKLMHVVVLFIYTQSELTWFMKGLRHTPFDIRNRSGGPFVRIDLIYEGIATHALVLYVINCGMSELTWFMKGLRLSR